MKRTYNDFRRITRSMRLERRERSTMARSSQTAAAAKILPPLKRLKTSSFQGFDVLPNELVEMIVKQLPRHLDGVTRVVCNRWKDAIDRRWQLTGPYRNPVKWAIQNHSMALLKWIIRGVDPQKRHKMFEEQEEWEYYCSMYVNVEALEWLSNQSEKAGVVFLTETGVEAACRYGDLVFLKKVLTFHGACKAYPPQWYSKVDQQCLIASCAGSGGLQKVKWIRQQLKPDLKLSIYLLRQCWRLASAHAQLDIFKWAYSNLIPSGCSQDLYGKIALNAVMHGSKPVILEWFSMQPGVASMAICHASFPQKAINDGKASALEWWWQKNNKDASKAFGLAPFDAWGALQSTPVKFDVLNWLVKHDQFKMTPNFFLCPAQLAHECVPILEWLWSHTPDKTAMLGKFGKTGQDRLFVLLEHAVRQSSLEMCKWLESHGFLQAGVLSEGGIRRLCAIVRWGRRNDESEEEGEEVYRWWMTSGKACLLPAK